MTGRLQPMESYRGFEPLPSVWKTDMLTIKTLIRHLFIVQAEVEFRLQLRTTSLLPQHCVYFFVYTAQTICLSHKLFPTIEVELSYLFRDWSYRTDSNCEPTHYKCVILPLNYGSILIHQYCIFFFGKLIF